MAQKPFDRLSDAVKKHANGNPRAALALDDLDKWFGKSIISENQMPEGCP